MPDISLLYMRLDLLTFKKAYENYTHMLLLVVSVWTAVDVWQSLKCILCPWKSRMACSPSNLSPKVKLTSNQHLQPFPLPRVLVRLQKLVPRHMLPAACETVVVERRKERERFLIKAPQKLMLFFSPYALDCTCDVSLKPSVTLNCEAAHLTAYSLSVIVSHIGRLHILTASQPFFLVLLFIPSKKKMVSAIYLGC